MRVETAEGVARLALDRPEKKNAFTAEMYRQLGAALAAADADASVRAVLLHGTRDCFSAGNDLADFLKPRAAGEESPAAHLFRALLKFVKSGQCFNRAERINIKRQQQVGE